MSRRRRRRARPRARVYWRHWRPHPLPHLPVLAVYTGRTYAVELPDRGGGPRAKCRHCGAVYSTSAASDPHPCNTIAELPRSSWDPGLRPLERRPRETRGRYRPHTPTVLASPPVEASVERIRCFVCQKIIGDKDGKAVTVAVQTRDGVRFFGRHSWCRGSIPAHTAGREGTA